MAFPQTSQTASGGQSAGVPGGGLVLALILSCITAVALGLAMVLISIDRTELAYGVQRLKSELRTRGTHSTQLEVERERLLSPYVLGKKAGELGMREARPGQTRRMDNGTLETVPR